MTSQDCCFGFEIFDCGIFWVGKFGKYFLGGLIYAGIFWGYQNNLTICGSACVSQSVSQSVSVRSAMKMTTKGHGMT